jgi:hypothetical protein
MFDRVHIVHGDKTEACFICLGKHNLHFVSRDMDQTIWGKKMSYLDIEKVAKDINTTRRLWVGLRSDHNRAFQEDEFIIRSDFRDQLLERIGICWQAEFMYRNFQVAKFPIGKTALEVNPSEDLHNIDLLQVAPFKGYDSTFSFRGYNFWLREGFRDNTGMKGGTFVHDDGWEVAYGYAINKVIVPPECTVTLHINDPISIMELEKDPDRDELRTVATSYRQSLCEGLGHVYVLVNNAYSKRMNRGGDLASWEGWELVIRAESVCVVCIILRRSFIPPLCDTSQDIAVLMRCAASRGMNYDTHEVLLDECRLIADSLTPMGDVSEVGQLYTTMMRARLDALQYNEDAYQWIKGYCDLEPVHSFDAKKFLKGIMVILDQEGQMVVGKVDDMEELQDIDGVDPMMTVNDLISDFSKYFGEDVERRTAWEQRISRYLAYCVDGGILGDRFMLANVIQACGKCSNDANERTLKNVVEYLLHLRVAKAMRGVGIRPPLMQILQEPDKFAMCDFNERVMKTLLMENYIQQEWKKRTGPATGGSASVHYERLLAALLRSKRVGLGLRTLICRQIMEDPALEKKTESDPNTENLLVKKIDVLVPALVAVMDNPNVSLVSCATAALVNLSSGRPGTKTLLMQQGCMKMVIKQLKAKDEDLLLYTLYLLVNMTKTPQHRSIVVRQGGLPLLFDILSSSYQDVVRKRKILTELCSVLGQMCNDLDICGILTDEYPVVNCLLWMYDAVEPNTKLKAKILFAIRQLCQRDINKAKVGRHTIFTILEELALARRDCGECAMHAILLLTDLATVHTNSLEINKSIRDRLVEAKIKAPDSDLLTNKGKFSDLLIEKIANLLSRLKIEEFR